MSWRKREGHFFFSQDGYVVHVIEKKRENAHFPSNGSRKLLYYSSPRLCAKLFWVDVAIHSLIKHRWSIGNESYAAPPGKRFRQNTTIFHPEKKLTTLLKREKKSSITKHLGGRSRRAFGLVPAVVSWLTHISSCNMMEKKKENGGRKERSHLYASDGLYWAKARHKNIHREPFLGISLLVCLGVDAKAADGSFVNFSIISNDFVSLWEGNAL